MDNNYLINLKNKFHDFYNNTVINLEKDILLRHPESGIDESLAINKYMTDTQAKRLLMDKFLQIFGGFTWSNGHSFFNINNLIILPDKLSMDTNDCVDGQYSNIKIRLTEVYFGFNAFIKHIKDHKKLLNFIKILLFILFFIVVFASSFGISSDLQKNILNYFISFFLIIFLSVYFIPILYLIYNLINKCNRGLVIEIDMPKNFEGETVIFENSPSNFVVNKSKLKKFERTELEDVEFNKKYLTYTTNQIEARYILTTAFIERLKNIKFAFKAKYLRMLFRNNRITIFAEVYKDLFSMVKDGKTDKKVFDELFEEMYSVLSLVDELKLNIKTGL